MKTLKRTLIVSALFVGGLVCTSTKALGEAITFTLDSTQSALALSAVFVGIPLEQQGSNSLVTSYAGTVEAGVSGTTIKFLEGSSIVALNNGSWEPSTGGGSGTAPANYGGQGSAGSAAAKAALREIVVGVVSSEIPISMGSFPAETLLIGFPTNANSAMDYAYTLFGFPAGNGTYPLSGYSTNSVITDGTLNTNGNELELTVPVNYTGYTTALSPNDVLYTLTGEIVARAAVAEPPLQIGPLQVSPGQLVFTINTKVGEHYTILAMTDLSASPTIVDEFTATENPAVRVVAIPFLTQQFFKVRQD